MVRGRSRFFGRRGSWRGVGYLTWGSVGGLHHRGSVHGARAPHPLVREHGVASERWVPPHVMRVVSPVIVYTGAIPVTRPLGSLSFLYGVCLWDGLHLHLRCGLCTGSCFLGLFRHFREITDSDIINKLASNMRYKLKKSEY